MRPLRNALLLLLAALPLAAQKGTLVIAGGGTLPPAVYKAFTQAAGGPGMTIGVITSATEEPAESFDEMKKRLEPLGLKLIWMDVDARAKASAPALLAQARTCAGFWFCGGDQMRVNRSVVGTPLHALIREAYGSGSVVGGTSAGAAIMSRIMIQGTDDTSNTAPGSYATAEGIGLLPEGIIVDQHFLRRSRENRLLSLIMEHPGHLGLGIDEDTALLVKDGLATVIGSRRVLVLDPAGMKTSGGAFTDLKLHLLAPGQAINLATRAIQ